MVEMVEMVEMLLREDWLNHVERCDAEDRKTFILSIQDAQTALPHVLSPSQTQTVQMLFMA